MPHQCTECERTFADGSKQMLAGCPDCGGNKFQFQPKGSVEVSDDRPAKPARPKAGTPSNPADSGKTRTTTLREWARKVTPGSGSAEAPPPDTPTSGPPSRSGRRTASASQSASASSSRASTEVEQSSATSLESFADPSDDDAAGDAKATDDTELGDDRGLSDDAEAIESSDHEDAAQADARSGVVGENELPDHLARDDEQRPPRNRSTDTHPTGDRPTENSPPEDSPPEDQEPRPDLAQLREELNDQFESIKVVEPGQYELNLMELYDREEYIIALQENGRYVIEVPDAWDAVDT